MHGQGNAVTRSTWPGPPSATRKRPWVALTRSASVWTDCAGAAQCVASAPLRAKISRVLCRGGDDRFDLERVADHHGAACAPDGADGVLRAGLSGFVDQQPPDLPRTQALKHASDRGKGGLDDGHEQKEDAPIGRG